MIAEPAAATSIDEEEMAERPFVTGLWRQPGVPHGGWACVEMEDLGPGSSETCEMCEAAQPRYIHIMAHPDYPDQLGCGCICAGNMEHDLAGARQRERTARNRAMRRRNHPKRQQRWITKEWRESMAGNEWCAVRGHRVVIYGVPARAFVEYPDGRQVRTRAFLEPAQAKLAAFDLIFNDDGSLRCEAA